ncbi:MAG TPA: hypothetical protein PK580_00425 [Nitrosomonas halophila]|nr:hypothetical protein [Nitrosomonas halophila]
MDNKQAVFYTQELTAPPLHQIAIHICAKKPEWALAERIDTIIPEHSFIFNYSTFMEKTIIWAASFALQRFGK